MKKLIIAGNWKLYITDAGQAKKLVSSIKRKAAAYRGTDIILFPPAPLLSHVIAAAGPSMSVGAQHVSAFSEGAYTGYDSSILVKNLGGRWALVGHSEQRTHENEDEVHAQVKEANDAGLSVLLCVGESERDPGGAHFALIERQLSSALAGYPKTASKLAIAYEPVWAIGKSAEEAMKPQDLEEMAIFIRRALTELFDRTAANKIPILYGGSVDATNARDLVKHGGVSGLLVGRTSADAASFLELIDSVQTDSR